MVVSRAFAIFFSGAFCAGCATSNPPAFDLELRTELPRAQLHERDSQAGKAFGHAIGGAAAGGALTVAYGCVGGGPIGCVIGLVLAPVGMIAGGVAGASKVKPIDTYQPVDRLTSAAALLAQVDMSQVPAMLSKNLVDGARQQGVQLVLSGEADSPILRPKLVVSIVDVNLSGRLDEDAALGLRLVVQARLVPPYRPDVHSSRVPRWLVRGRDCKGGDAEPVYESRWRLISEWRANGAELFREELAKAAQRLAQDVLEQLRPQLEGCKQEAV